MDFKGLLKDRIFQVLLFVVILNLIGFVLVWQINLFVHGDLYDFGLVFSSKWADDFSYFNIMLWVFLEGALALSVMSIFPHYLHSKKATAYTKWLGFLLPALSATYLCLSIWFLWQIDWIVQNTLLVHGLVYSVGWSSVYYSFSTTAFALMIIALVALMIPAIRILDIIEIEIVSED